MSPLGLSIRAASSNGNEACGRLLLDLARPWLEMIVNILNCFIGITSLLTCRCWTTWNPNVYALAIHIVMPLSMAPLRQLDRQRYFTNINHIPCQVTRVASVNDETKKDADVATILRRGAKRFVVALMRKTISQPVWIDPLLAMQPSRIKSLIIGGT